MKLIQMIEASEKSAKYANGKDLPEYTENHIENVKNMMTVQEGTALAGGFCNWIMEVSRNHGLDMVTARALSNRLQRVALDSKHTSGVANFMELPWARLASLRNNVPNNISEKTVISLIDSIIDGNDANLASSDDDEEIF